jgi:hypothetical protein
MAQDKVDDRVSAERFEDQDDNLEKNNPEGVLSGEAAADLIAGQQVELTEEDVRTSIHFLSVTSHN